MPNGEYEYTDISLADFEAALNVIIDQLEGEAKRNTPTWQKVARQIMPSWVPGVGQETIEEQFNRMFDEIMAAVTQYGLSPDVARSLTPEVASIFNVVLKNRANYEWQKQYKENLGQWKKDVVSQIQRDYTTQATEQWRRYQAGETEKWRQFGAESGEAWRRYAAEVDATKFQWQQGEEQRRLQAQASQARGDWARMRMGAFQAGGREEGVPEREQFRMFESMRGELLAGLGGPENWIQYWGIANKPNPYEEGAEMSPTDRVREKEEEVDRFLAMSKRAAAMASFAQKDEDISLSQGEKDYINYAKQGLQVAYQKLAEAETQREREGPSVATQGDPTTGYRFGPDVREPPRPTTPPTPSWLGAMYPKLGERMPTQEAGFEIAPPSGQAWGRLTPSQRQGWGGFARYYGASPQDLLAQTQQMLPKSPWQTPQRRWTPARQRVSV